MIENSRSTCLILAIGLIMLLTFSGNSTAADPRGVAIHIGLNTVDPAHYGGWDGELFACENDANDMQVIAKSKGFETSSLISKQATRSAVLGAIADAAKKLSSGKDILLVSYSGHGAQVFDENGDERSNGAQDVLDETWCLFDGEVLDDEIYAAFRKLAPGTRILLFSDSCHSGTVAKTAIYKRIDESLLPLIFSRPKLVADKSDEGASLDLGEFFIQFDKNPRMTNGFRKMRNDPPPYRVIPADVAKRTWATNREFYRKIGSSNELGSGGDLSARGDEGEIEAHGLLISGCQDNQLSKDGWVNGAFTGALKRVWTGGDAEDLHNYRSFHGAIKARFENDPTQTPNFYTFGTPSAAYESQAPFSIQ